jgi:calpain-15
MYGSIDNEARDYQTKSLEELCKEHSKKCLIVLEHFRHPEKVPKLTFTTTTTGAVSASDTSKDKGNDKGITMNGFEVINEIQRSVNKGLVNRNTQLIKSVRTGSVNLHKSGDDLLADIPTDSKTYAVLSQCISSGKNYKDREFPHNMNSITLNVYHECYDDYINAVWERPNEIFNCDHQLIYLFDNIDPEDIAQGTLGVCYFLTAMSSLAEFPTRVMKMFVNKRSNKYGVYGVRFYVQGIPTEIVVDDYIPCEEKEGKVTPFFSRPKGNELWVLLAEKAWAKIYGNYVVTEAGYMDEAFEYLLGEPAFRYLTKDQTEEEVWKILKEADHFNWILCGATGSAAGDEEGLVANHAYTIISVHEIGEHKILKLRNPWAKFEWKGDFSDDCDKWTDELKSKIGYTKADDGIFCMALSDFKKYFQFYSIGACHTGWEYAYLQGENEKKKAKYFKMIVPETCESYLRIHHKDTRFYGEVGRDYLTYPYTELTVAKVEANGTYTNLVSDPKDLFAVLPGGERTVYPTKHHRMTFAKGEYIVRVKAYWAGLPKKQYTFSTYSSSKVEIQACDPVKNFYKQMFINDIKNPTKKENRANNCFLSHGKSGHNIYICAENKDPKQKWTLIMKLSKLENLKVGKPFRTSEKELKIEVLPGKTEMAYLKKIEYEEESEFAWELKEAWQIA